MIGKEEYRGYTIVWDVTLVAGEKVWKAQSSVVLPSDRSGIPSVHPAMGPEDRFATEEEERNHAIGTAKRWIDNRA